MSSPTPELPSDTSPSDSEVSPEKVVCHELAAMQKNWWWFLALGIGWVVLGTIALSSSLLVSLVAVALFGVLMLIAGIAQVVSAFWSGKWSGAMVQLLVGILYTVVGFMIFDKPGEAAVGLTLLIAGFLIIGGIIRIVLALSEQFSGWGWVLLNGIVTLLLGILIFKQWPLSGAWVIGLFVGIEMIFNGWYWIMLSLGIRKSPKIEC